jgi:hypothetical protein
MAATDKGREERLVKREQFAVKRLQRRRSSLDDLTNRSQTPYDETSLAGDDWEGPPAEGPFFKWGLGAALPAVLACYGVAVLASRAAHLRGRYPIDLYGKNAVALGAVAISLALFLHCHYLWSNVYHSAWPAELGKILGLLGIITGLATLIVRVGVFGAH